MLSFCLCVCNAGTIRWFPSMYILPAVRQNCRCSSSIIASTKPTWNNFRFLNALSSISEALCVFLTISGVITSSVRAYEISSADKEPFLILLRHVIVSEFEQHSIPLQKPVCKITSAVCDGKSGLYFVGLSSSLPTHLLHSSCARANLVDTRKVASST